MLTSVCVSLLCAATFTGCAAAPTDLIATPGDGRASIAFTPGSGNGAAITNYEYSTDNGASWTRRNPVSYASPVVITGLNNGTTYQIKLHAINSDGIGAESTAVSVTPAAAPAAPSSLDAAPGDGSASIAVAAGADNGAAITNYEYSTDNGASWTTRSPVSVASPIVITGLTNGTTYQIKIRAINSVGTSAESSAVNVTPTPTPTPTLTPKPSNRFVLSSVAASSSALQAVIVVSSPGKATQRGTFNSPSTARSAKRLTACAGSKKITKAGRYTIDCTLTSGARSARRRGAIRVTLVTTFTPTGGTARSVTQTVTLKKPSSGVTG